jgi:nitroreductase
MSMEFYEVLRRRRMVRRFLKRPVPPDVLDRILSTVHHAPSAGFSQGIALIVLDTPEQLDRFWRTTTGQHMSGEDLADYVRGGPPLIVLPLSDKRLYLERYSLPDKAGFGMDVEGGWPVPYWDIDTAMAVMLMLLAAVDEGLGGWFFGIFEGEEQLLTDLGVPEGPRLIGALALGYPDRRELAFRPAHRPLAEIVHRGKWEAVHPGER